MEELKLSVVTNPETMKDILIILNLQYDGLENLITGLDSYKEEFVLKWLMHTCHVYIAFAEHDIKAVFIFEHLGDRVYNSHWCTLDNRYKWFPFFRDVVLAEIAKYAHSLVGYIKPEKKALLRLYRRYGYEPLWRKDLNRWKYLINL